MGIFSSLFKAVGGLKIPLVPRKKPAADVETMAIAPEERQRLDRLEVLRRLSYDVDSDPIEAIKLFQKHCRFEQTGNIGPRTAARLDDLMRKLAAAPMNATKMRPWRLTHYYVATEADFRPIDMVPVYDTSRRVIATVPAVFFCDMALEGTGKLKDGRLLNVAGRNYVTADPDDYVACKNFYDAHSARMKQKGKTPRPSKYFGISLTGGRVTSVQPFQIVPESKFGVGYGTGKLSKPYTPYETLASDIGAYGTSDARFRGKGGLVPPGTRVFILEFVGRRKPDGSIHDGWFVTNDTGGGIYGAHFDVFTGTKAIYESLGIPTSNGVSHVWFEGIEERVSETYTHGLYDK